MHKFGVSKKLQCNVFQEHTRTTIKDKNIKNYSLSVYAVGMRAEISILGKAKAIPVLF